MRRGDTALLIAFVLIAVTVGVLVTHDAGPIAGLGADRFAELAYRGIWIAVIGSSAIILFRNNLFGALRAALLWVVAFTILIGGYAYAPELTGVRDRILAVVMPGRVIEVAGSNGRQFMVMRSADEHFRVQAMLNGKALDFLVDTGASLVALDKSAARALGIDTTKLSFSARLMTANGVANAALTRIARIRIGDIERRNVEAAVMEADGDGLSLLGMSFLGTLASVEFRGDRLILTD